MSKKKKYYDEPYAPDPELAHSTLEIAKHNIKASIVLYDNELFPESIFFLQQAIEKGCKSFGYNYGIIDTEEALYDISHSPSRVYGKSTEIFKRLISNIADILNLYSIMLQPEERSPPIKITFLTHLMQKAESNQQRLDNLTSNEDALSSSISLCDNIEQLLSEINGFTKMFQESKSEISDPIILQKAIAKTKRVIEKHVMQMYRHQQPYVIGIKIARNYPDDQIKPLFPILFSELEIMPSLLALAIITQPHESSTRYPDYGLPMDIYTINHPLIKHFKEISAMTEHALSELNSLFKMGTPESNELLFSLIKYNRQQ